MGRRFESVRGFGFSPAFVEEKRQQTEHPFGVNLGLAWYQRERLASALTTGVRVGEADTFYGTGLDRGWPDAPHRTLRNSTVEAWERAGRTGSGSRPGESDEPASLPDGSPINR